jgi:hypothetical protein
MVLPLHREIDIAYRHSPSHLRYWRIISRLPDALTNCEFNHPGAETVRSWVHGLGSNLRWIRDNAYFDFLADHTNRI